MPSENAKTLEFICQKSYKAPFIIYGDVKCLIEKTDGCKNNSENTSITKVSEDIPSGFSMSTISSFKMIDNKYHVYRGIDFMKKFCETLRGHTIEIINFRKKMKLLMKEQQESYQNAKTCYICKEKLEKQSCCAWHM